MYKLLIGGKYCSLADKPEQTETTEDKTKVKPDDKNKQKSKDESAEKSNGQSTNNENGNCYW